MTPEKEIVWEFINPWRGPVSGPPVGVAAVYRAYRVPYEWVPQLDRPRETAIEPLDVSTFRVPGAAPAGAEAEVRVEGTLPYQFSSALCVVADTDEAD